MVYQTFKSLKASVFVSVSFTSYEKLVLFSHTRKLRFEQPTLDRLVYYLKCVLFTHF